MKDVTSAKLEVFQVLAREGIQLSEGELLSTARNQYHELGSGMRAVASLPRVSWYLAVLCRLGIHEGPWEYLAENQCIQVRECRRCGADTARIKHKRAWSYVGNRTCDQTRFCTRCNAASGHRTRHQEWSDWWTVERYTDQHECLRCGVVKTRDTSPD